MGTLMTLTKHFCNIINVIIDVFLILMHSCLCLNGVSFDWHFESNFILLYSLIIIIIISVENSCAA